VKRFVARFPISVYFVTVMAVHIGIVASQYYEIRNHGLGMLRLYTPAIIALAVTVVGFGWAAAKRNLLSLVSVKVHPKYYLFALLYPAFVGMLALTILRIVGAVPDIHVDWEAASGARFFSLSGRVSAVEEIAWIGFLLHMFARRYRLFQASALTGLMWGIWYIPLVLAEIQVVPGLPIAPLILNFMTIGAICAWLYLRTHSAAPVFIMQVTTNYTSVTIPVLPQRGGMVAYVAFVVMKALFALALFLFWGPKPLFGRTRPGGSSLEESH
jgi:membrane protease YdiL (CAAX protease family)